MSTVNEWVSEDPHAKLNIPEERTATQKFRWSAKELSLSGTCARFKVLINGLAVFDALVDTSERFQGTVLKKRVTHRTELYFVGTPVLIFPFRDDDLEEGTDGS
jgi:hypothetical protein